jgi:5-carboxymethyl-2-hydroxymuconate isomerase
MMPHLTLEYSDGLVFDTRTLFKRLHEELVATGAVNLKGLKSRAVAHREVYIADGNPNYKFAHLDMLLREGRPLEVQQDASKRAMRVLEEIFGHLFETGYLSLSVNLREMREGVALTHHNIPPGETRHG